MAETNGVRLDAYLRERGPVPPGKAAKIATEILNRIEAAAAGGNVRPVTGITPARILIGSTGQVSLLDPPNDLPAPFAAPGSASPEEIRGAPADARSAIYSLGCALFELLTGRPPFTGGEAKDILEAHLGAPVPDARQVKPEIPPGLAAAVSAFLAKDPVDRPPDAAKARELLRAAVAPAAAVPAPSGFPPAAAAPASPMPAPVAGAFPVPPRPAARPAAAAPRPAAPPPPAGIPTVPPVEEIELVDLDEFETL